jgi:adenine-specific DNA-methyltransferase
MCFKSFNKTKINLISQPSYVRGKIIEKQQPLESVLDFLGTTSSAKDEIHKIFGSRNYFSTPKPLKLFIELIRAVTKKDSIVLDCFAGSGTTGHAIIELNRQDKGNRRYILISNNESGVFDKVLRKRIAYAESQILK